MKLKSRSLSVTLLKYFLIFSIFILGFLYAFQILFFNSYYKYTRTNSLKDVLFNITKKSNSKNFESYLNRVSIENEVCILFTDKYDTIFYSDYKHCARNDNQELLSIVNDFIKSKKSDLKTEFISNKPRGNGNYSLLVYGKKLSGDRYVFVNTSLVPLDMGISLLKSQFKYIVILVVLLSIILSFYFSKRISKPIERIANEARKLGSKNEDADFNSSTSVIELQNLSKTLTDVKDELAKTEELRREFLANISHDLKTPLTMIEAYASSAKDLNYNNKKKRERDLNIIIDEAERLNMLVNDILTVSKIESKSTELVLEKINIKNLIRIILERFSIYINDGYSFEFNEKKDYFILADRKAIERVIYNLIINAINYTGSDKKVKVALETEGDYLLVKVIDSGKGINESDKDLVWNKYYQTNKRHSRNALGFGLGLSIVRVILEEHDFLYGFNSVKNKGTCFWFKCKLIKRD